MTIERRICVCECIYIYMIWCVFVLSHVMQGVSHHHNHHHQFSRPFFTLHPLSFLFSSSVSSPLFSISNFSMWVLFLVRFFLLRNFMSTSLHYSLHHPVFFAHSYSPVAGLSLSPLSVFPLANNLFMSRRLFGRSDLDWSAAALSHFYLLFPILILLLTLPTVEGEREKILLDRPVISFLSSDVKILVLGKEKRRNSHRAVKAWRGEKREKNPSDQGSPLDLSFSPPLSFFISFHSLSRFYFCPLLPLRFPFNLLYLHGVAKSLDLNDRDLQKRREEKEMWERRREKLSHLTANWREV